MTRLKQLLTSLFLTAVFYYSANAQSVIWYENFNETPCTYGCIVNGYAGNGGNWTDSILVARPEANEWYVSCAENGNAIGSCGSGCAGKNTLHIGNIAGSPNSGTICSTGDCGAIYDFGIGGGNASQSTTTKKRAISPTINCLDFTNITLSFNYMTNGDAGLDQFTLFWYDGTYWDSIIPPKTPTNSCPSPHYGAWKNYSIALPASVNKSPNVRIGFQWVNNSDGKGSDPSVAIDSIQLVGTFILPPIAKFAPSQNNFCQNTCISFADQSTNYPASWSWNFGGGGVPNTSTDENPTNICFNNPGSYFVVLTATNANGIDTEGMTIVVNPCTQPIPGFSIKNTQPFCYGDCDTLTNTSQDATSYSWDFGGAATPNTSTAASPVVCFNQIGNYDIVLTATNSNGSATSNMNVTVDECLAPAFDVTSTSICTNNCISFTDLSTGNPTAWQWSFPGATPATSTQQNPANVCYPNTGTFDVTLTVSNGGGSQVLTKPGYISVIQSPTGTVSNDTSIKYGDSTKLSATGGVTYLWTPASGLSDSAIANPVATPTITTTYMVTITGANGCTEQLQVVVTVIQPQLVFVPNTFTPNGDGLNDIFKIFTAEPVLTGELRVFDRWGELLFETTDLTEGWDGTYKGKPMSMGVFVYWYRVTLIDGKTLTGKGDITLLR